MAAAAAAAAAAMPAAATAAAAVTAATTTIAPGPSRAFPLLALTSTHRASPPRLRVPSAPCAPL